MTRAKIFVVLFLLSSLLGFSGCAGGIGKLFSSRQIVTAREAVDFPYHLQPGDELDISVWGQERLNSLVQVRDEGTFPFPLIGEIQGAGQSMREVEIAIQQGLERYYAELDADQPEIPDMPKRIISSKEIPSQVYRLRPGDELEISVWKHDDLNQTGVVREDGILHFL